MMKSNKKRDTHMLISISYPHDSRVYFCESVLIKQMFFQ